MKTLIDIGAHHGEGYERLRDLLGIDSTWAVHHYEPNPISMTMLLQRLVHERTNRYFHCLAVGEPSLAQFFLQRDLIGTDEYTLDGYGSSLASANSTEGGLQVHVTVCVVSLDTVFSVVKSDEVYVKIDIEGAEYGLDWGSIPQNAHCFVEWHPYGTDDPVTRKAEIIASRPDITWHEWD